MIKHYISTLFIFVTISIAAHSQRYDLGVLPSVNVNHKLVNDIKLNYKIESRQLVKMATFQNDFPYDYNYVLTDFSVAAAIKTSRNKNVIAGYLMRVRGDKVFHRFMQQFTVTHKIFGYKTSHRFAIDETVNHEEYPVFRIRYRFSPEIPLSGKEVDAREFYLKTSIEWLTKYQKGSYDSEIRVVPNLGYEFTDRQKLELGIDYRAESFLKEYPEYKFYLAINWFVSF